MSTKHAAQHQTKTAERSDDAAVRHASSDPRPLLVTTNQAARMLGIARSSIYQLIARGDLSPIHIGRSVRLPVRELETFVERLTAEAS